MTNICVEEDCGGPTRTRRASLCERHYKKWYRSQSTEYNNKARAYANEYRSTKKANDPDAYVQEIRVRNLWVNYKLSVEDYEALLSVQQNCCAICSRHQSEFDRRFSVDHDHSCCPGTKSCGECVRGLLCGNCNQGLGRFRDDTNILQNAVEYVNMYSMKMVNES